MPPGAYNILMPFRPRLFTAAERDLLKRAEAVASESDPRALRSLRALLRGRRDAFRGRLQRQQRESRGRQEPRARHASTSHANTEAKVAAFVEALAQVERRLALVEQRDDHAAVPFPAPGVRAPASRWPGGDPARAPGKRHRPPLPGADPRFAGRPTARNPAPSAAHRKAKQGAMQAHGRRNQARRDGR